MERNAAVVCVTINELCAKMFPSPQLTFLLFDYLLKNWQIPASFSFIFVLFLLQFK